MDDQNRIVPGDRTIAAVFHSQGEAESAHDALYTAGFHNIRLSRMTSGEDDKGLWQSIKDFFTDDQDVTIYGEAVRRGKALLTVHVLADRAAEVVDILDRFAPIDLDAHERSWREEGWEGDTARRADGGNARVRTHRREFGGK